ncbi:hypothetical protein [Amycolatopsis japonica]|uniref:hypothetical protein n=1 Tax=Amycolatopsis japonica TaxID=208439 RepID=UPI0033E8AFAD
MTKFVRRSEREMHFNGRVFGRGLMAVAMAVTLALSSVVSDQPSAEASQRWSTSLASVLVPPDQQAPGSVTMDPITLAQAAEDGGLGTPGMTSSPESCLSFADDSVGGLGTRTGWMQFGRRGPAIFLQVVAKIPGGFDVNRVRTAVASCATGTMTLEGKITGQVTFVEQRPLRLLFGKSFVTRMTTTFPKPANEEEAALLTKYNFHEGECPAEYVFVAVGNLFIWSLDPDPAIAVRAARIMYERALRYHG